MSGLIPDFDSDGYLPAGDYEVTFEQLRQSTLVKGPADRNAFANWDEGWRSWLVDNLEMMTKQLWQVGITDVFADGSFTEDKYHPNDIDGYFVCDMNFLASGRLQQQLNLLDPQKVWTWDPVSRRSYRGYPKMQLPMWHVYRVELFPHFPGLGSGVKDQHGNEFEFPSLFRQSRRDGRARGIIKLIEGT